MPANYTGCNPQPLGESRDLLKEALRDLMARLALDTPEECADVAMRLGIEDHGSLWEAAEKAQAALDRAGGNHKHRIVTTDENHYTHTIVSADGQPLVRVHYERIPDERLSFVCPDCGAVSYHPQDIENSYCGRCHEFKGK